MIYSYEIDENCEYIPVHLNVVFNNKVPTYLKDTINSEIADMIYQKIKDKKKKYIVMDFDTIDSIGSRIFTVYSELVNEGYNFLFINLNSICMSILKDDDLVGYVDNKDDIENCLFTKECCTADGKQYLKYCKKEEINKFSSLLIANYLYENRDPNKQQ